MGNTGGLEALLSTPKKEEVEDKIKKGKKLRNSATTKRAVNKSEKKSTGNKDIKAENKIYRSFYITDETSNLVNRVVNTIKIDNSKYNNDMAIFEAFKLLAKANGIKV